MSVTAAGSVSTRFPTAAFRVRLSAAAHAQGMSGAIYIHFGHAPERNAQGQSPPRRFAATRDVDEASYCEYLNLDPLTRLGRQSLTPFVWTLQDLRRAAPEADPLLQDMARWGMEGGVTTPVHDYAAGPALLTVFSRQRLSADARRDLSAAITTAHAIHRLAQARPERGEGAADLSPREMEVLRLAAHGLTEVETAQALGLSRRGVQFHLARVMEKFDAPNKTAAVARVVSLGLISV
jgi:DNA-binding CsgD family transcriptional regulator